MKYVNSNLNQEMQKLWILYNFLSTWTEKDTWLILSQALIYCNKLLNKHYTASGIHEPL